MCQGVCINGAPEDHQAIVEILQNEVSGHIQNRHQIFVPSKGIRQEAAQEGGGWGKDTVEQKHQCHSFRDIVGRLEGVTAVEGEIPQD